MVPTNAAEGPRSECIGYAAFSRRLETDHDFRPWLVPLAEDVAVVAAATAYENRRLVLLQQQLIDLIDFLDPKKVRIPAAVPPAPGRPGRRRPVLPTQLRAPTTLSAVALARVPPMTASGDCKVPLQVSDQVGEGAEGLAAVADRVLLVRR